MFPSRRFSLFGPSSMPNRLDCCPPYIVIIHLPKDTEKYSADDEVVWSNIKLNSLQSKHMVRGVARCGFI